MSNLRSDIRTRVRDYLHESVADIFADAQLNRYISEELLSLPSKEVYAEGVETDTLELNVTTYPIPSGVQKIEKIERDESTGSAISSWVPLRGWDTYGGNIYLDWLPSKADNIRMFCKKAFTVPSGDVVALDIPDDKSEVLVWGVVVRAYKQLIGYLRNSVAWDTVTKPGDLSIPSITGWLRDARKDYNDLIKQYRTEPRPREIDMVS